MGWSVNCTPSTKAEFLAQLDRMGEGWEVIAARCVGNNYWRVIRNPRREVFIALDLLMSERGCWGHKDICESMGPAEENCPLSFLDLAPVAPSYGEEWRARVRKYHADRKDKAARVMLAGMCVSLYGKCYRLVSELGRKGWIVVSLDDGKTYRMPARQVAQATVEVPAAPPAAPAPDAIEPEQFALFDERIAA